MKTYNGIIRSTELGFEEQGNFIAYVYIDLEFGTQGFGGNILTESKYMKKFIISILGITGVDTWEKLPGTYVRIKDENGILIAIGNIIQDSWFNLKEDLA